MSLSGSFHLSGSVNVSSERYEKVTLSDLDLAGVCADYLYTSRSHSSRRVWVISIKAFALESSAFLRRTSAANHYEITLTQSGKDRPSQLSRIRIGRLLSDGSGGPGFPNQVGYVLHLSSGSITQVAVDDTVFPTQASGTIYIADTPANSVYAVTSKVFPPNSAFTSASDTNNYVGRIDLQTGKISPIITGLQAPHGALFVSSLPEVRLDQLASSGGASGGFSGVFRVSRTGDVSQALQIFLNIADNSSADPESSGSADTPIRRHADTQSPA